MTEQELRIGANYFQRRPGGGRRILRYLGKEHGTFAFVDFETSQTTYYPFFAWADLEREVSLEEILTARRRARHADR